MEIGLFIALIVILYTAHVMYKVKRFQKRCLAMFKSVFSNQAVIPEYIFSWSYGYPSFKLVFPTSRDLSYAKESGITAAFELGVKNLCANNGSKKYPFEAERSIWLTSKEELGHINEQQLQKNAK